MDRENRLTRIPASVLAGGAGLIVVTGAVVWSVRAPAEKSATPRLPPPVAAPAIAAAPEPAPDLDPGSGSLQVLHDAPVSYAEFLSVIERNTPEPVRKAVVEAVMKEPELNRVVKRFQGEPRKLPAREFVRELHRSAAFRAVANRFKTDASVTSAFERLTRHPVVRDALSGTAAPAPASAAKPARDGFETFSKRFTYSQRRGVSRHLAKGMKLGAACKAAGAAQACAEGSRFCFQDPSCGSWLAAQISGTGGVGGIEGGMPAGQGSVEATAGPGTGISLWTSMDGKYRSGDGAHDIDGLAAVKDVGGSRDAGGYFGSAYGQLTDAQKAFLDEACFRREPPVCDPIEACRLGGFYDACMSACNASPPCREAVGGPTPTPSPSPGPPGPTTWRYGDLLLDPRCATLRLGCYDRVLPRGPGTTAGTPPPGPGPGATTGFPPGTFPPPGGGDPPSVNPGGF